MWDRHKRETQEVEEKVRGGRRVRLSDAATSQQTPDEGKGKKGPYPPTRTTPPEPPRDPSAADTLASDSVLQNCGRKQFCFLK